MQSLRARGGAAGLVALVILWATAGAAGAAQPAAGAVSPDSPRTTWTGGPFVASNPTSCFDGDPACDSFALTIVPSHKSFVVDVAIEPGEGSSELDDYDLFVFDPDGREVGSSTSASGFEHVTLENPRLGTYEVVVQAFTVVPGSTYAGSAELSLAPDAGRTFHGTRVDEGFEGTPANRPARQKKSPLRVRTTYVGTEAFEPTLGVNARGTAFYVALPFDTLGPMVLRSRDGGTTWERVQPQLPGGFASEPPNTNDPYLYVDPDTGRVFSIDLQALTCSWLIWSDDEGETWGRNPLACGEPANDHQTIVAGLTPPDNPSLRPTTEAFPEILYYCFNRVSESSCGRSRDGGATFEPAGDPSFLGFDPDTGGQFCGGLHGHIATDPSGRLFVPKGHCGFPWLAVSEDGADTWRRHRISGHVGLAHHEVSIAIDSADNVYAVWSDGRDRLPYLSHSTDGGRSWSTPLMIAPPGVHETNFPTIAAGDTGRIAITFPGTTVDNIDANSRPWNSYVLVSTDALSADPLFRWTTANDPADPVRRGDCGPGRCGNMGDFIDIQTSPADGDFWATAVDTCVGSCVSGTSNSGSDGLAIRRLSGPSLWAPGHRPPK